MEPKLVDTGMTKNARALDGGGRLFRLRDGRRAGPAKPSKPLFS